MSFRGLGSRQKPWESAARSLNVEERMQCA